MNTGERVYAIFALYLGVALYGYMVGNISSMMTSQHSHAALYRNKMVPGGARKPLALATSFGWNPQFPWVGVCASTSRTFVESRTIFLARSLSLAESCFRPDGRTDRSKTVSFYNSRDSKSSTITPGIKSSF